MCEEKSHELSALPQLIAALDLSGANVTIDAMARPPHISSSKSTRAAGIAPVVFGMVIAHMRSCGLGGLAHEVCWRGWARSVLVAFDELGGLAGALRASRTRAALAPFGGLFLLGVIELIYSFSPSP
jgi:hypothetical protein